MVNTSPQTAEKCKRTRAWERRKEHRPGELLDAALEVFVARGYAAARLDDVAARAGVSKGTLYLYYAGKEDLFKAVVRVNIVPVIEQFRQRIEQATGSNEELLTNVLTDWWHCFSQPHIGGIIKLIIAEASNFPEIARFFHEEVASIGHGVIRQLIQRGVERQEFRKPCEMDVAAHLVMSPLVMKLIWAHSMTQCGVPQLVPCGAEFIHHHVALILSLLRTPGTGLPGSSASAGDTTCLAPAGNPAPLHMVQARPAPEQPVMTGLPALRQPVPLPPLRPVRFSGRRGTPASRPACRGTRLHRGNIPLHRENILLHRGNMPLHRRNIPLRRGGFPVRPPQASAARPGIPSQPQPNQPRPNQPERSAMNLEQARFNMIEQQIRPWRVNDARVLDILGKVLREEFVPQSWRGMAYADTEVPLNVGPRPSGQIILPPRVDARMLQALQIQPHETVLEVGTGSGYGTALVSHCSRLIQSWEIDPELAAFAAANLARTGLDDGLELHAGDGHEALKATDARWDVIILSGAVVVEPGDFLARLNPGGRLFCFIGEAPVMEARVYTRTAEGIAPLNIFETMAPPLKGFPTVNHFHF